MKKQIAVLFMALCGAHADLIDIVLFDYQNGASLPPAYLQFVNATAGSNLLFFDEAISVPYTIYGPTPVYPPGWVSQFGVLNGGQYFFTDLFSNPPDLAAQVSWNFSGSDKWLTYIDVFGRDSQGTAWSNLYGVPYGDRFGGSGTVTLNGATDIRSIAFYGTDPLHVPDSGATALLLAIGTACVGILRRKLWSPDRR
jgi:hypothetical protein